MHAHLHKNLIKPKKKSNGIMQSSYTVKEKKGPDLTLWTKDPPNVPLSSFSVGIWPILKSSFFSHWDSLTENYFFSFTSGFQLEIALGVGMELCPLLLSALWPSLAQIYAVPRHAASALWVYVCASPLVSSRPWFLVLLHPLWLSPSFCPSIAVAEPEGGHLMGI